MGVCGPFRVPEVLLGVPEALAHQSSRATKLYFLIGAGCMNGQHDVTMSRAGHVK